MYNVFIIKHYFAKKRLEGQDAEAVALVGGGVMGLLLGHRNTLYEVAPSAGFSLDGNVKQHYLLWISG